MDGLEPIGATQFAKGLKGMGIETTIHQIGGTSVNAGKWAVGWFSGSGMNVISNTMMFATRSSSMAVSLLANLVSTTYRTYNFLKPGMKKMNDDFWSGNDQNGLITTATPEMRANEPVKAFVHQLSYNIEDGLLGYNAVDNSIASIYNNGLNVQNGTDALASTFFAGGSLDGESGELGGGEFWTSTKKSTSVENAYGHWQKHGAEFPEFYNSKQYVEGTRDFLHNSPEGTLSKIRPNGDILKYDPLSNTFGVMNAAGTPRTMFKPNDGLMYWLKQ